MIEIKNILGCSLFFLWIRRKKIINEKIQVLEKSLCALKLIYGNLFEIFEETIGSEKYWRIFYKNRTMFVCSFQKLLNKIYFYYIDYSLWVRILEDDRSNFCLNEEVRNECLRLKINPMRTSVCFDDDNDNIDLFFRLIVFYFTFGEKESGENEFS
jgi:hypothetical protein